MHAFVAEIDGMLGFLQSAERRSLLALSLLNSEPNVWLQAVAKNTLVAVAILRSDVEAGLVIGGEAADLSERCQAASSLRATHGNLGFILFLKGNFERASEHLERAIDALRPEDHNGLGVFDTLARMRLAQGRLEDCEMLVERIEQSVRTVKDRTLYGYRHVLLTKARLLILQGRNAAALECADRAIDIALRCGDELLLSLAKLTRAEVLVSLGELSEVARVLGDVGEKLHSAPASVRAEYQRILACAATRQARLHDAHRHAKRATQILATGGNQVEINYLVDSVQSFHLDDSSIGIEVSDSSIVASTLQTIAEVLTDTGDPSGEASLLATVLNESRAVTSISTVRSPEITNGPEVRINLGAEVQLVVETSPDIAATATVNAAKSIASAVRELRVARALAEQQAAIWPAEPLPNADLRAVIVGHMDEMTGMVRRVARTTVPVLLLGPSGTGKEILARAVHEYSDRAAKNFVAVNCAALPGHLLESTLFGYRRGAFTGADRDNPGLIRAATGGTLFLDELGELNIDLQPKLLRFLESGEIAPLGEVNTVRVDVRIVCATNRNLATLVHQGLFREDLFYRINVVRLTLKPLRERRDEIPSLVTHFVAAAAEEFHKGYVPVAEETMERLLLYRWPGNIRQLQNEMRRMVALVEPRGTLEPDMISNEILDALPLTRPRTSRIQLAVSLDEKLPTAVARIETEMIRAALRTHHGRVDAVAKALGISRKGLYLKRQRLGV